MGVLCAIVERNLWLQGHLPEGVHSRLCWRGERPRCSCGRQRVRPSLGGYLLLHQQRRHLHHRKRRSDRSARAGEDTGGNEATQEQVNIGFARCGFPWRAYFYFRNDEG